MALDDEFRKQGEWLFRWRSFLPLILVPLIGIALAQLNIDNVDKWGDSWDYFCLGVSFLGLLVRVVTVGYVPEHTSGRNTKAANCRSNQHDGHLLDRAPSALRG